MSCVPSIAERASYWTNRAKASRPLAYCQWCVPCRLCLLKIWSTSGIGEGIRFEARPWRGLVDVDERLKSVEPFVDTQCGTGIAIAGPLRDSCMTATTRSRFGLVRRQQWKW